MLAALGQLGLLFVRTLRAGVREPPRAREVLRQAHDFGNRTAWLVVTGMAFFGIVMVTIANSQARKFTGSLAVVGSAYFEVLVREFGPMISAMLAAARSGATHSAELSQMSVQEQLEALEMSAADPLSELLFPRILGSAIAMPLLAVLGTVSASLSAALAAQFLFDTEGMAFLDARYVDAADLASSFLKALLCGIFVPLAAGWRAMGVSGGSVAVGKATTEGVVAACVGCLALDFLVALGFRLVHL